MIVITSFPGCDSGELGMLLHVSGQFPEQQAKSETHWSLMQSAVQENPLLDLS